MPTTFISNFLFTMFSMRSTLTFVCAVLLCAQLSAQSAAPNFWTPVQASQMALPETARQVLFPKQSQLFQLDVSAMRSWLRSAPMEFTGQKPLLLQMPDAAGQMRQFEVWESPVMAPELAAKYPGIRTYSARPTDGSGDVVRLGVGHKGFYAFQFRTDADIETVRPYAEGQDQYYMAYRLADLPNDATPAGVQECGVQDANGHVSLHPADSPEEFRDHFTTDRGGNAAPVQLRKYRAAISSKGEYSKFHGGTKPLILSAMTEAMNFIAAIMERDFSLRIELVPDNDKLIYLDPATDPYEGTEVFDWMEQNQAVVTNLVGSANFDLGHVFSVYVTGSAVGVAGGRVCNNSNKARACSSAPQPNAEYFYLVTAHEMCHQMTGDHTWNTCTTDLTDQRRSASTMEPGSGSTIMSYAGSCGSNNVQGSKDGYFHVRSIDQVRAFYTTGSGTCASSTDTDNTAAPEVTIISPNNVFIPILTPFQLHATATDADGDAMTYCWEQYDNGPETPLGEQVKNSALFRSYKPITTSTSRYFPRLQTIITNGTAKAELLPDSTRQLNFRFTARDNHPGAGAQTWGTIRLNSTLAAGPFLVTSPNKNTDIWYGGENRTVTWNVANTDKAPVNCEKVNILLSTDNANTYDFVLAAGVPNNGSYCVKVPLIEDNLCRIRVEGVGNVFFDVSNAAFKIKKAEKAGFTLCTPFSQQAFCLPGTEIDVDLSSELGFSTPVTLTATGLPAGAVATFSPNPALPGTVSKLNLQFPNGQPEDTYNLTITGTADTLSRSVNTAISVIFNDFPSLSLLTPANSASGTGQSPLLTWSTSPNANSYAVQVATSPSFEASKVVASATGLATGSYQVPVLLEKSAVYYWRVGAANECGTTWMEPFVFGTVVEACGIFSANDLPKVISASGAPTVESVVTLNAGGAVSDVNVKSVQGNHTFFKDLELTLIGPDGTPVALAKDKCGSYNGQFKFGFDDDSPTAFGCPPSTGAIFKPAAPLSAFKGKDAAGPWTLRVKDNVTSSGGNLAGFELEVCSSVALNPPFIVTNDALKLDAGTNALITNALLKAEDANNSAAQLTYTLVTVPKKGELQINGTAAQPGAQFTQADLDNGTLRYFDLGSGSGEQFRFVVTDGEGGFVEGTFVIKASVSAFEPTQRLAFDLAPNPATESLRILFGETLGSDARVSLFNTAGQQLRSLTLPNGTLTYLLDVADLPDGLYVVMVQNERASGVRKVVVRH